MSTLLEIKKDLESDIKILKNDVAKYEDRINAVSWGLSRTSYDHVPPDSLINYLITDYSDNKLTYFGFNKLQNLNYSNYYEYDKLVNRIKDFYLIKVSKFHI